MSKQFVPPGYVANLEVIEAVAIHLFPQAADEPYQAETETEEPPVLSAVNDSLDPFAAVVKDGLKSTPLRASALYPAYKPYASKISAEDERQIYEVLHTLRALLYKQKLTAWYVSPVGGGILEVPNSFWLSADADHALGSGEYWPFGKPSSWYEKRPMSPLFFKSEEVKSLFVDQSKSRTQAFAKPRLSNAGAKRKFDWPAYEEAFTAKVAIHGLPEDSNVKGWQSQADVMRYLQELAQRDGLELADSTAKPYAKAFLDNAKMDEN